MAKYNPIPREIPLRLNKHFTAIVDFIDGDLQIYKWSSSKGYAHRIDKTNGVNSRVVLHRVIMSRVLKRELLPDELVDHIDHNPCNNRRSNLRLATPAQNAKNSRKQSNNTSGYKGVTFNPAAKKKKWIAQITSNGKAKNLGTFYTREEAAIAYNLAASELHGEFACLNVIED